jgi:hypothetical protein
MVTRHLLAKEVRSGDVICLAGSRPVRSIALKHGRSVLHFEDGTFKDFHPDEKVPFECAEGTELCSAAGRPE